MAKEEKTNHTCETHGDISNHTMDIKFDGVQYGNKVCARCWWDFMSKHVNEAKEQK